LRGEGAGGNSGGVPHASTLHVTFARTDEPVAGESAVTGDLKSHTSVGRGVAELVKKVGADIIDSGEHEVSGHGIGGDGHHVLSGLPVKRSDGGEAANDVGEDLNTEGFKGGDFFTDLLATVGDGRVTDDDEHLGA